MSDPDPKHFTKAVTELGDTCPVLTTQAIFNDRGIKIIDKGVQVNAALYQRLTAHRLTTPIEQSVATASALTGRDLRASAEAALQEFALFGRMTADGRTRSVLLDAVESMPLPAPMAFQLTLAQQVRPALYRHSVHAALFAAWLAWGPLVTRFDVAVAASAGMLHDLGMLHLDPLLLQPQGQIGSDQRRQLYSHPIVSSVLVERHHEYPKEVQRAILEHHEFADGSGYPRHLDQTSISPMGRLLAVAELVTATLASRPQAPELQLWVRVRMNRHCFDAALLQRVLELIEPEGPANRHSVTRMPDPVGHLRSINHVLADWPLDPPANLESDPGQRKGLLALGQQVAQLRRSMAAVGVAPAQLEQLGAVGLDDFLSIELTLIAREAAWQLRALSRHARRRWGNALDTGDPEPQQRWLDRVDQLVAQESAAPGQADQAGVEPPGTPSPG